MTNSNHKSECKDVLRDSNSSWPLSPLRPRGTLENTVARTQQGQQRQRGPLVAECRHCQRAVSREEMLSFFPQQLCFSPQLPLPVGFSSHRVMMSFILARRILGPRVVESSRCRVMEVIRDDQQKLYMLLFTLFWFWFSAPACLCELCRMLYFEATFGTNSKQVESSQFFKGRMSYRNNL